MKKLIQIALITLYLSGCVHHPVTPTYLASAKSKLQGSIQGDIYHHPEGLFSVRIPKFPTDAEVRDLFSPEYDLSTVVTYDDYGNLVKVEVIAHTDEEIARLNFKVADDAESTYRNFFTRCILDSIKENYPDTVLIEENIRELDGIGKVYLAIIDIPKGSNIKNAVTGERMNSRRAYMISICANLLVTESVQESVMANDWREFCKRERIKFDNTQSLYDTLIVLRQSFKAQ